MITTVPEMRALMNDLTLSVWTLTAIGVLFEAGLVEHLREPVSAGDLAARCPALSTGHVERLLAVASAAGVVAAEGGCYKLAPGTMPFLQQPLRAAMGGDVRGHLLQALAFLDGSSGGRDLRGWRHTDRALLQAQGDSSASFPPMLKANVVPGLGDLAARLDRPGARFLDVGAGVGALAIAMCRAWPELRVVGIDTFDAPLSIAKENIAKASLEGRIEMRQIAVEDLADEDSFDLAWLPAFFISEQVLPRAAARIRAALRPGGWMLLPVIGATGDDRQRAVPALVTSLWGGPVLSLEGAQALLKQAGFSDVRSLAGPPWAPALIVGQR